MGKPPLDGVLNTNTSSFSFFGKSINKKKAGCFLFLAGVVTFFQKRVHHDKMIPDF